MLVLKICTIWTFSGSLGSPSMLIHPSLIHGSALPHCPGRSSSNSTELFAEKNVHRAPGPQDPGLWTGGALPLVYIRKLPGALGCGGSQWFLPRGRMENFNYRQKSPQRLIQPQQSVMSPFHLAEWFPISFCLSVLVLRVIGKCPTPGLSC